MPKRARVPPSLAHMATLLTVIPGRLGTTMDAVDMQARRILVRLDDATGVG
jgi:hypothetical protein